jgi:manganese/zinc/iron transport system substrate-binding protein
LKPARNRTLSTCLVVACQASLTYFARMVGAMPLTRVALAQTIFLTSQKVRRLRDYRTALVPHGSATFLHKASVIAMLRRFRNNVFVGLLGMAAASFGCATDANKPTEVPTVHKFSGQHPIRVVCTTGPVSDMLKELGGDSLEVTGLMGPGVDPHLYTAVPADVERLDSADMIFYNGLHLEGRMAELFEDLSESKPTYAVTHALVESKDSRLRKPPEFEGYYDPHVWHDPNLWKECVKYVADVLGEFDSEHREEYAKNRDAYIAKLEEADGYAREQLGTIPAEHRVLVSAHDAFNYFCEAYKLTPEPLKGVSTEDEVTIGRMEEVAAYLIEHKIKAVFVESAVKPEILNSLIDECRQQGHEVRIGGELYADALGPAGSGADNYLGMIKANVDTIVAALK